LVKRDSITVLTPSLPERGDMLAECVASIVAQTRQPEAHLIGIDYARVGVAEMLNRLWPQADSEWIAVLADDDLADPAHLRVLAAQAALTEYGGPAGVVYSYCRVTGRRDKWCPNRPFSAWALRQENYVPATALIRKSLIEKLGGWRQPDEGYEDWDFWKRALDAEARFVCVQRITWTYRFHGGNTSARDNPSVMAALSPP
jgi:hypothetical protein